jgi:hypothetical protein
MIAILFSHATFKKHSWKKKILERGPEAEV